MSRAFLAAVVLVAGVVCVVTPCVFMVASVAAQFGVAR